MNIPNEQKYFINNQYYSFVNGSWFDSKGNKIKDSGLKSILFSSANQSTRVPIGSGSGSGGTSGDLDTKLDKGSFVGTASDLDDKKVDKVIGKQLSTEDYTTPDKEVVGKVREILTPKSGEEVKPSDSLRTYAFLAKVVDNSSPSVPNSAYFQSSVQSVTFSEATTVEISAFFGSSISDGNFPKVQQTKRYSFASAPFIWHINNSQYTSIKLPDVKIIDYRSFVGCTNLITVSLPTVSTINTEAFSGCSNLTSFSAPNCYAIKDKVFHGCNKLEVLNLPQMNEMYQNTTLGDMTGLKTYSAPLLYEIDNTISNYFAGCPNLVTVDLRSGKQVPANFLRNKVSLTSVKFNSARTIGNEAFYDSALKTGEFDVAISVGDSAFKDNRNIVKVSPIAGDEVISLPKATKIGKHCFKGCHNLKYIELPEVVEIADGAFEDCTSLETVILPKVTTLGKNVFNNCSSLRSLTLPLLTSVDKTLGSLINLTTFSAAVLTTVSDYPVTYNIFDGCPALVSISLPMINSVYTEIFQNKLNLKSVNVGRGTIILQNAFTNCKNLLSLTSLCTQTGTSMLSSNVITQVDLRNVGWLPNYSIYDCPALNQVLVKTISWTGSANMAVIPVSDCPDLTNFHILNTNLPNVFNKISSISFPGCPKLGNSTFQSFLTAATKRPRGNLPKIDIFVEPEVLFRIEADLIDNLRNLENIHLQIINRDNAVIPYYRQSEKHAPQSIQAIPGQEIIITDPVLPFTVDFSRFNLPENRGRKGYLIIYVNNLLNNFDVTSLGNIQLLNTSQYRLTEGTVCRLEINKYSDNETIFIAIT